MACFNASQEKQQRFITAYKLFDKHSSEPGITYFHIRQATIKASRKYRPDLIHEKKDLLRSLQGRVSALRNTNGGCVLIHLCDKNDTSLNLSAFDEFADAGLKKLICDGSLYTDTYTRRWLSEDTQFKVYTDIIVLTVSKCKGVSTVEHNTKVASDHEIFEPQYFELLSLLKDKRSKQSPKAELRQVLDDNLYESRSVQLKSFPYDKVDSKSVEKLADFIWKDLRFREYLSSFSKVDGGGSYYVGVTEAKNFERASIDGLPSHGEAWKINLKAELRKKLDETVLLRGGDLVFQKGTEFENLINIEIHYIGDSSKVVLEIAVGFVGGILFYDQGPRAYKIDKQNTISKMQQEEWRDRLKRLF